MRGTLPREQAPQLAAIAEAPPEGEGWFSEIKFDGYRLLASVDHGEVRLLTRNGHDWADRLPAVAKAVGALGVRTALLDGELVALRENGASSFPDLQAALSEGNDGQLTFFLFDLPHLNGWDLRPCAKSDVQVEGADAGLRACWLHHETRNLAQRIIPILTMSDRRLPSRDERWRGFSMVGRLGYSRRSSSDRECRQRI